MSQRSKLPAVLLVGRTNVGKSTLFNALTGTSQALVSPVPGTTRDMNQATMSWREKSFILIDSGGFEDQTARPLSSEVRDQVEKLLSNASLVCLVVDAITGVTNEDRLVARRLKNVPCPVLLAINKTDRPSDIGHSVGPFRSLGISTYRQISAISGIGTGDFLDDVVSKLPGTGGSSPVTDNDIRIALIGKTNTGKWTIANAIAGDDKFIISPNPHTTREPRDVRVTFHGKSFVFVDTAGLRKERKISDAIERAANLLSGHALKRVDIAIVVTDSTQRMAMHDAHVVDMALAARKGIIVVANKWDAVQKKDPTTMKEFEKYYRHYLSMAPWAPIVFTSGLTRKGVYDLFKTALRIRAAQMRLLPDDELSKFLQSFLRKKSPGGRGTRRPPRIFSLLQQYTDPPGFLLTVNDPKAIAPAFIDILEKKIRAAYDFFGTPISITLTTRR
ncbi:MAG TPA: ribosome biogenesis GTPase Der [Candidatus Kerfeldbacteria bacterium]|nr:ribosome biogenesis GTPase Der [Candidatus Kerfeldbacteria bacterium]